MTHEEFVATKQRMSSHAYGKLVGDAAWEDEPPVTFLVYANTLYIEADSDGTHILRIERQCWWTDGGRTLHDLEQILFDWFQTECCPN